MDQSISDHLKAAWLTTAIGFAALVVGVGVLFWNEGQAVRIAHSLDEALSVAVSLNDKGDTALWEYEGSLVHVSSSLKIGEPLTEPDYMVEVLAVKLKRRVQMYQWIEETHEPAFDNVASRSDTTYSYTTEWRDKLVDSNQFYIRSGHQNPIKFPFKTHIYTSDHVKVGALALGYEAKDKFTSFKEITSDERPDRHDIKLHAGMYYHCEDIWNPEVGDIRVQFSYAGLQDHQYTIVGQQVKGTIRPFHTLEGHDVLLVFKGALTLDEAFKVEHSERRLTAWGFRGAGWFLLFLASSCLIRLLHVILSHHLVLHNLMSPDAPMASNIVLSLSLTLLVTSVSWILYRPMLGASLAAAAASPFVYCAISVYNAAQGNVYHRL